MPESGSRHPKPPPAIERVAGAVSGVAVAALLGFLVHEGLRPPTPPDFEVVAARVERVGRSHQVAVEVRNVGGATAAEVVVRGELTIPGAPEETSEATIDYVPPRSMRKGVLLFRGDPDGGTLVLSVRGFALP